MPIAKVPERIIMTNDTLRARVLVAHHLEHAVPLYEQGDFSVHTGSYNGTPLAVVSTGFGKENVLQCLSQLIENGASQIVYLSTCISAIKRYDIRTVILCVGGSEDLLERTLVAAERCGVELRTSTVLGHDVAVRDTESVVDDVTGAFYEAARKCGVKALSLLTVSENTITGAKMEESEIRARLYPASELAFEIWA